MTQKLYRKPLVEANICDTGFIFLNDRYFLRYLSGLYTLNHKPSFATKLQVFDVESFSQINNMKTYYLINRTPGVQ